MLKDDNLAVMNAIQSNADDLVWGGVLVANIVRVCLSCNKVMFSFVKK